MLKRYYYHYEIVGIIIALLASYVGGQLTHPAITSGYYHMLVKSSLTPPDITFPIVWTILFILMGIGIGRVWRSADSFIHTPLETGLFFTQLGFNILWSYLFFYLKQPILSFLEIIPLWFLIIYTTYKFYKADVLAGLCYLPYVIWVVLAVYLNYFIAVHN